MRIGLFSDTFPPDLNGVANSTYLLSEQLKKHGHDVFVVCTRKGTGWAKWNEDHTVLRLAGVTIKYLYGYAVTSPFHVNALNEVRELNLDVIHVQTEFGVGIFARFCAKQLNIPLVSTYHTSYEDYTHYINLLKSDRFDAQMKKAVAWFSKYMSDSSAAVIAPSEKTKKLLECYHVTSEIHVVPTGLDLELFAPEREDPGRTREIREAFGFGSDERTAIYLGRIAEEKAVLEIYGQVILVVRPSSQDSVVGKERAVHRRGVKRHVAALRMTGEQAVVELGTSRRRAYIRRIVLQKRAASAQDFVDAAAANGGTSRDDAVFHNAVRAASRDSAAVIRAAFCRNAVGEPVCHRESAKDGPCAQDNASDGSRATSGGDGAGRRRAYDQRALRSLRREQPHACRDNYTVRLHISRRRRHRSPFIPSRQSIYDVRRFKQGIRHRVGQCRERRVHGRTVAGRRPRRIDIPKCVCKQNLFAVRVVERHPCGE